MVAYRRPRAPGATFFFTVNLRDRRSDLLVRRIDLLRAAYADGLRARPVRTEAVVVLPDHLHAVWTLPGDDADFAGRWRAIKAAFVRRLRRAGVSISPNARGEAGVWQRRFWEHTIRDAYDFEQHVAYVHYNPVRHGYVARAVDWPYSSIHRFIARGDLAPAWAAPPEGIDAASAGEREQVNERPRPRVR